MPLFRNFTKTPNLWRQKGSLLWNMVLVLNVFILGDFRGIKKYFRDLSTERVFNAAIFLQFGLSANYFLSEHIHRMLLSQQSNFH